MSKQHRDIVARMSEIRDDMVRLADKAESKGLSASDEKHYHLDAEFKQLDVQRMKLERELDIAKIQELAKDPRNLTPGFEAGGAENDVRRRGDDSTKHRAGLWLANQPAMIEGRDRIRAQWGLTRALSGSGTTNGGALTPSDQKTFIFDFLAAQSVFLRSGVVTMQTDRDSVIIPHATADAASGWVAEAGTISPTDPTADQITATPRKLAGLTVMSNEVIADSNPSVLDWAAIGLLRSLSLKFDPRRVRGFWHPAGDPRTEERLGYLDRIHGHKWRRSNKSRPLCRRHRRARGRECNSLGHRYAPEDLERPSSTTVRRLLQSCVKTLAPRADVIVPNPEGVVRVLGILA
jgi:hypothetical protein